MTEPVDVGLVGRLRGDTCHTVIKNCNEAADHIEAQAAEIKRLTDALEFISSPPDGFGYAEDLRRIAQAALKEQDND